MSAPFPLAAYDWIAHHARRSPGKLAAVDESTGRRLTYAQLDERVGRLAGYLARELGVQRGERVAMLLANSTDAFELQFACFRLGAILLPLNWRLRLPELEFLAVDASPRVLVYDAAFQLQAHGLMENTPVERLLLRDGSPGSPYERAIATGAPVTPAIARLGDTCTILYTAGTTGLPKGALITHQMTLFNALNIGMATELTSKSVCLATLPVFHTGGLNLYANPVFHLGGTVVVQRNFDPERTLALISDPELGATHFFGVPAMYLQMCQSPAFAGADLSRLVATGVGGAPAPLSLLEAWAARGCSLQQGFGMTETSPSAIVIPREMTTVKVGSVGLPVMHGEAVVADTLGRPLAPGETGELWVRGPHVTPGYWKRPQATAESFTDGWLHTGDAARMDDDGYFYLVDRWKDMYISGGENVYPAEVENAIYQLDEVAEVAVIGVPDERWGEVGRALAVLKPGRTLTEAQVIEHCRARLAGYKCPRSVVFLESSLPRNAAGKVLKNELKSAHGRS